MLCLQAKLVHQEHFLLQNSYLVLVIDRVDALRLLPLSLLRLYSFRIVGASSTFLECHLVLTVIEALKEDFLREVLHYILLEGTHLL